MTVPGREPNAKPEPLTPKQEQDVRTSVEGDPGGRNGYVPNAVILRLLATLDAARVETRMRIEVLSDMWAKANAQLITERDAADAAGYARGKAEAFETSEVAEEIRAMAKKAQP